MIRAAVFDIDGTLLDSMEIWEDLGASYLKMIGIEAEADLNEILYTMSLEESAGYMKKRYGLSQRKEEIILGITDLIKDYYERKVPLKKGAKEFLQSLCEKGILICAATSSERTYIEAALSRLGVSTYIKRIFTCTEVGAGKTSPLIYLEAAAFLGTAPEETMVFEDALFALETAKRAGFKTTAVFDHMNEKEQSDLKRTADHYLPDFTDFQRLRKNI